MTTIVSEKETVNQTPEQVFAFLSDFNNFEKLMPEQVTDWRATAEACTFTIKGMAKLGMKIEEKTPNTAIKIARDGDAPFDFKLNVSIEEMDDRSNVQLSFDADLNPFLKMMAEKPLRNFLNLLVTKYREIHE